MSVGAKQQMEDWLKGEMEKADVDVDVYLPYMMEFMEDGGNFDCDGASETLSAVMDVCVPLFFKLCQFFRLPRGYPVSVLKRTDKR